ncbi:OST-HTH/LOTUS domain-containing protein [uncultured Shewanella sp.]|uniref:OST-HTH/LOTUS domain-containing protein n=1 Tax=uncultured Shewanella sp. TaxID=173975 RepID=UPI002627FFED|nr:OST-HTH/LOTUS domain-containing protein [uncultured Shewanella sp.]
MKNEEFVDDVLRRVGRNVVLFQQLEQLLKFIVANGKLAGFASELKTLKEAQESKVNKQTMGTLVGQYVENSNPESDKQSTEPEEIDEIYFSFSFRIECDDDYYKSKNEALAQLVTERNDLIHHLLPRFDMKSPQNCKSLSQELDEQSDKIRLEINHLKATTKSLIDGRKILATYFQSEEARKDLELSFLKQSPLILMLGDIATQISREDGWALISSAGQLIKEHAPEEFAQMKKKHGYSSLKKLIQASDIFDIYEEVTPKGGTRILYKLKAGC